MIKEDKYLIGTVAELASELVNKIIDQHGQVNYATMRNFQNIDFTWADPFENTESPSKMAWHAEGWYGIKKIATGFDSSKLELFADYYGGGSGSYNTICSGMYRSECEEIIRNLIINTMSIESVVSLIDSDLLVAEWV